MCAIIAIVVVVVVIVVFTVICYCLSGLRWRAAAASFN